MTSLLTKTVVAFGETLWDLLPDGPVLGGAPFNFAYRVNSLGDQAYIATRLGRDALGLRASTRIEALGMPPDGIQWDEDHPTGTVPVTLDGMGHPLFTIIPNVAYDYIEATPELQRLVAASDCILFGTLAQRCPISAATLNSLLQGAGDKLRVLDINLRKDCYTPESIVRSLGWADILKLNYEEAIAIGSILGIPAGDTPLFCDQMLDRFSLSCCLVTFGELGAFGASAKGERIYVPGYVVQVADTVGSGDAFTAGFVRQALRGASFETCIQTGAVLGALAASRAGGTALIDPEEIALFDGAHLDRRIEPSLDRFSVG